jgi:hypothetical protein
MVQRTLTLSRGQMLRAMPKHLLWAAVSGAVVGMLLYWLKDVAALPGWLQAIVMGTLWVNAAVLPVALPGRHWSFAFIAAMMLFLALVAGMILAAKFPFPHSRIACESGRYVYSEEVNIITWAAIITGGCLGLFYGLLVGRTSSMVVGLSLGSAAGYVLGTLAVHAVSARYMGDGADCDGGPLNGYALTYNTALHFAWQGALAMVVLHLGASLGAAMGTGPATVTDSTDRQQPRSVAPNDAAANPKSPIENRKSV